jgi:FkbM family methyltransferase
MGNFTRNLIKQRFLKHTFNLIDVGASFGHHERFNCLGESLFIIGFELDKGYLDQLESIQGKRVIYPHALAKNTGRRSFYHAAEPHSSGLYPCRDDFFGRYPCRVVNRVTQISEIEVISLSDIQTLYDLPPIDFIKLDVEGAELEILEGANSELIENVLAMEIEVTFNESHHGRCLFADIDYFMKNKGFNFLKFVQIYGFRKNSLPLITCHPYTISMDAAPMTADVLYVRDPLQTKNMQYFTGDNIIKLAIIHDLYNTPDHAIELLDEAISKGLIGKSIYDLYSDLIPPVFGRKIDINTYRALVKVFHNWEK